MSFDTMQLYNPAHLGIIFVIISLLPCTALVALCESSFSNKGTATPLNVHWYNNSAFDGLIINLPFSTLSTSGCSASICKVIVVPACTFTAPSSNRNIQSSSVSPAVDAGFIFGTDASAIDRIIVGGLFILTGSKSYSVSFSFSVVFNCGMLIGGDVAANLPFTCTIVSLFIDTNTPAGV